MKKNIICISILAIISITGFAQETDAFGGFLDVNGKDTGLG